MSMGHTIGPSLQRRSPQPHKRRTSWGNLSRKPSPPPVASPLHFHDAPPVARRTRLLEFGFELPHRIVRRREVDSQETMEETILVGDDLMRGIPSPVIPKEIASHVLDGVEICDGLQINDIEPFCQDEIVLYRQCAEKRDKEIRERLQDSEYKLGFSMPLEQAKERSTQLQSEVTLLERRMILASGLEGMEGFRQRWSLHGQLEDTRKRLEALNRGMEKRGSQSSPEQGTTPAVKKTWFFW
uniref:DUF7803 domain-containing protein n=1 Tax=Leersia perrieri TaxID=77586 RepID=A0A0D9W4L9_9ORYZ